MLGARQGFWSFLLPLFLALATVGCSREAMQPGDLSLVQTTSDKPRAGNVYLLRGWIGIWSTGINALTDEINQAGIRANVYRCEQWEDLTAAVLEKYRGKNNTEPLVLVGHSWGADHAVDLARKLQAENITVDLIVQMDPCTKAEIPENVKRVHNIYQSNGASDAIPFFRGVPQHTAPGSKVVLQNLDIRKDRTDLLDPDTDHYNIEKKEKVHKEVLAQILQACPPRDVWVRAHPGAKSPGGEAQTASGRTLGAALPPPRPAAAPVSKSARSATAQ